MCGRECNNESSIVGGSGRIKDQYWEIERSIHSGRECENESLIVGGSWRLKG